MRKLTISTARAIGKNLNAKGVAIFVFSDDDGFQACSYGRSKRDCGRVGKWLDGICDGIESGEIVDPFGNK